MSKFIKNTAGPRQKVGLDPSWLKNVASEPEVIRALEQARKDSATEVLLFGHAFPKDIDDLRKAPTPFCHDLSRILAWYARTIKFYASNLSNLLKEIRAYDRLIFGEKLQDARAALDVITASHGLSIWSVKQNILLNELIGGIEKQKPYSKSIWQNESNDYAVRMIAFHSSSKVEQAMTASRFLTQVSKDILGLRKQNIPEIFTKYFEFHFLFFSEKKIQDFYSILSIEEDSALIDRYLSFRRCVQLILSSVSDPHILKCVKSALSNIGTRVDDPLLAVSQRVAGFRPAILSNLSMQLASAINLYTSGQYEEAAAMAVEEIKLRPENFPAYEILAKAGVYKNIAKVVGGLPPLARQAVASMVSLMIADAEARHSHEYIFKQILLHEDTPWAAQVFIFLQKEYNHLARSLPKYFISFSEINGAQQPNPRILTALSQVQLAQSGLLGSLTEEGGITAKVMVAIRSARSLDELIDATAVLGLHENRRLRILADFELQKGGYQKAYDLYNNIQFERESGELLASLVGKLLCLIGLQKLELATEVIADMLIERPQVWAKMPLRELLESVYTRGSIPAGQSLLVAIIVDHYSRHVGPLYDSLRVDACEDYLDSCGVQSPKDLPLPPNGRDKERTIYFLRNICVLNVLDSLIWSKGTIDVQKQRLEICQLLLEYDDGKKHSAEYEDEIRGITKSLKIKQGIQAVEQSRIYVDLEGIRHILRQSLADSYERFARLYKLAPPMTAVLARLTLELKSATLLAGKEVTVVFPKDETLELLKLIVSEVRDQFTQNNEYGLNSSLSMGIRHGTLAGQIRPIFERAQLVTRKSSKNNIYVSNDYWNLRMGSAPAEIRRNLNERLESFSEEIDDYIDYINEKLIQVRLTHANSVNAFFDFRVDDALVLEVLKHIDIDTPLERFIEIVFEKMWEITEASLEAARKFFLNDAQNQLGAKLNRLRADLHQITAQASSEAIDTCCSQAAGEIHYCMQKVSSWFTRAITEASADGEFGLAIEIAAEQIENLHRGRQLKVTKNIPAVLLVHGRVITPLSHVFYNLFDNCRKYGRHGEAGCEVSVEVKRTNDGGLEVIVENPIEKLPSLDTANDSLKEIRSLVCDSQYLPRTSLDKVGKEGKSGFHKIAKLLYYDINSEFKLDLFYQENTFVVKIALDSRRVLV